jgi:membrane protease YdiL (CAAX protease family)
MEANEIKSGTLVISVLGIAAIELAARVLISRKILAPMSGVGLARVAEIFFLLALIKFREKRFSIIGLASTTVYKGFKRGLIWSISFGAGAAIVLFIIYLAGIKISALFGMPGLLVGPIAEEIFFRGILYGFFRRWGIPFAVILSTLLFVLPHAPSSGPAIPVTQLIGGILFAVSYEIEKNLLVPITIHSLGNLAIFTLAQMI